MVDFVYCLYLWTLTTTVVFMCTGGHDQTGQIHRLLRSSGWIVKYRLFGVDRDNFRRFPQGFVNLFSPLYRIIMQSWPEGCAFFRWPMVQQRIRTFCSQAATWSLLAMCSTAQQPWSSSPGAKGSMASRSIRYVTLHSSQNEHLHCTPIVSK